MWACFVCRRGYASAAQGVATRGGAGSSQIVKKGAGEESVRTKEVSWVPDPKSGFYKPENSKEIDMAELRASILNRKLNNN